MCESTCSTATRRTLLAAGAGALSGTAGCLRDFRTVAGRDRIDQLELEIRTLPADSDPNAVRIARSLEDRLDAVGVDARINTLTEEQLYRQVLLNRNFDVYVGQLPETTAIDPDALYPLLHSKYGAEPGWQNPFGYADPDIDELLTRQRTSGDTVRLDVAADLQRRLAESQPFVSIAFPDEISAVRETRFYQWHEPRPIEPVNLLSLSRRDDTEPTLRLVTTDPRLTENRNPIAAEFRRHGSLLELVYAPLVRRIDDEFRPWLLERWTRRPGGERSDVEEPGEEGKNLVLRGELRDGLSWHDGESLDSEDVAFTYEFLADTSLGRAESAIPTSRFRGRSSLVESVEPVDDRTFDVRFETGSPEVAIRAFTVPLLPEHIWREYTGAATIAGIEVNDETTDALVRSNDEPVGSGQLRFLEATAGEEVVFERVPDHPVGAADDIPDRFQGGPAFERLNLTVVPSDVVAVESVAEDEADATVSNLGTDSLPRAARSSATSVVSDRSRALYHVGFNIRRAPLSNFRFRVTIARLFDKGEIVDDVFDGYAVPATSPLEQRWVPPDLSWDGQDPVVPFFAGPDGEFDEERAREAFGEAGYRYSDDGELLAEES
ncbi:ABC-type transport system substrate-binding protein [Halalkaliarchaeum desulfuricum]|uniref:ABC-type transport system substrate-binding protein n=1 Tax=Halalkaliarchaeum desulfuricum TaxID=2055893 RepID=A0A343TJU3_9EURY|nr:ABC transporter substrate-binding protein [Halalkaliarchaeum desulfuricum]AUX09365.1 ABC-type transport system substrate-binding protein [Halalkaliarchaeum desulfuricum]